MFQCTLYTQELRIMRTAGPVDDAWEYGEPDERGWKEGFEEKEFNDLDVHDRSILAFITSRISCDITQTAGYLAHFIIDGFSGDMRRGDSGPRLVSTLSLRGETLPEQARNLDAVVGNFEHAAPREYRTAVEQHCSSEMIPHRDMLEIPQLHINLLFEGGVR